MVYPSTPFRRWRLVGWRETLNRKRLESGVQAE
jgi:hypothetical protein